MTAFGHERHDVVVDGALLEVLPLVRSHCAEFLDAGGDVLLLLGDATVELGPDLLDGIQVRRVGRPVFDEADVVAPEERFC